MTEISKEQKATADKAAKDGNVALLAKFFWNMPTAPSYWNGTATQVISPMVTPKTMPG